MLLLDGVEGPPTTEPADVPDTATAIAGAGLDAAAAMADVVAMTARFAPAIAAAPDGMEPAGFIPPGLSCSMAPTLFCAAAVGFIADKRRDSVPGILMVALTFFLEGFRPESEFDADAAPVFTPDRVDSTGRTALRSECDDAEGESETGSPPPSCA